MFKFNCFLIILIIISFSNCARHIIKKPLPEDEVLGGISHWQDGFRKKTGTGEITFSEPDYRFSCFFSFDYSLDRKALFGRLFGSFGISVGSFYFSRDSISIRYRDGKEVKQTGSSGLKGLTDISLQRFFMWDIPLSSDPTVIPLNDGWILSSSNLEVFLSLGFLPIRAILQGNSEIIFEYSKFRTVEGEKQPFRIVGKSEYKRLEIEFRTMELQ
ncbi:MAG: hypothetical protein U9N06_05390 [candidate division WOR-3 bacterium]|nr:hypothetical protein [candidate division WOR-3 bacterium]